MALATDEHWDLVQEAELCCHLCPVLAAFDYDVCQDRLIQQLTWLHGSGGDVSIVMIDGAP